MSERVLTGLSTGNDIVTFLDGRETVSLDRSWYHITRELYIVKHDRMETGACLIKALNWVDTDGTLLCNSNRLDTKSKLVFVTLVFL